MVVQGEKKSRAKTNYCDPGEREKMNVAQFQMLWTDREYIGRGEEAEEKESAGPPDRFSY
jgi:hypothetical protein